MNPGRNSRGAMAIVLLLLPMCLTSIWAIYLYKTGRMPLTGDEPHYLLIADSISRDGDLDVRNNYEEDAARPRRKRVLNVDDWRRHQWGHLFQNGDALYGKHEPGLPLVLALPYRFFGTAGAKFGMIFLIGLSPFLFFWIARRIVGGAGWAVLIALSLSLGLPVSLASIHIYVDMLAGLLILLAVECLYRIYTAKADQRTGWLLCLMVLALSALPWLKIVFALPAAVCTCAAVAVQLRRDANGQAMRKAAVSALPGVSILLFLVYLKLLFGRFGHPNARVVEINWLVVYVFLRLHLDVFRGVMMQQPLLFAGVTGFAVLLRKEWRFAVFLLVLYLSAIGPHAANVTAHGFAPMGRYAWSTYPLWIFPICALFATFSRRERVVFAALCGVVLGVQFLRVFSWAPNPLMTYYPLNLPSAFSRYTDYVPNFYSELSNLPGVIAAWVALVLFMAAWGFFWKQRAGRAFSFVAPAYFIAMLFFLHSNEPDVRKKVWEAETMSMETAQVSPEKCDVADEAASGGQARRCSPEQTGGKPFCLVYTPGLNLAEGNTYRADFYLKTAKTGSRTCVAILDIAEGRRSTGLARRLLAEKDFDAPLAYQPFSFTLSPSQPLERVQFRVFYPGLTAVWVDRIEVTLVD